MREFANKDLNNLEPSFEEFEQWARLLETFLKMIAEKVYNVYLVISVCLSLNAETVYAVHEG